MLSLDTHFARAELKGDNSDKVSGPLQSLIYELFPRGKLLTERDVVSTIKSYGATKPDEVRGLRLNESDIRGALKILVGQKLIKEANGIRLAKFLESLWKPLLKPNSKILFVEI